MGAPFDRGNHRHTDVGNVLEYLCAFVVDLAPDAGVGDIAEGREIDAGNEFPACAG